MATRRGFLASLLALPVVGQSTDHMHDGWGDEFALVSPAMFRNVDTQAYVNCAIKRVAYAHEEYTRARAALQRSLSEAVRADGQ